MVSITSFQYVYQCKPTICYKKKYRIAYFISISVFLLLERETGPGNVALTFGSRDR